VRYAQLIYRDLDHFKRFCVNVFGWDMFVTPASVTGGDSDAANPPLLIATGPSYETWEGFIPGHMNAGANYDPSGKAPPGMMMEIHMDAPVAQTLALVEARGGAVTGGGDGPGDADDWVSGATVADPAGNLLHLWKCPGSRTWEEPETDYDRD
jgi:predicted enzyme related to lactoylglutathione lyase